jgi:glutaredoxin-related protein
MKTIFITFGSHNNYIEAANRLINQAKQMNMFTEIILYTPEYLQKDSEFWNNHGDFINKNKRGYGYWLWKSYIIKKTMENMNDDDILLYLDCGCELGLDKKDKLLECINIVKTDKIVGTLTGRVEKEWNKMDLVVKLNMNTANYLNTIQRQAGANLFLLCSETRSFVNEWYELSCDYHNIDDTPSIEKNLDVFIEHRHDQSIFSLLTKKYNIFSKTSLGMGIYYIRNRTGEPKIGINES